VGNKNPPGLSLALHLLPDCNSHTSPPVKIGTPPHCKKGQALYLRTLHQRVLQSIVGTVGIVETSMVIAFPVPRFFSVAWEGVSVPWENKEP
jgi:hypothetical protein